MDKELILKEIQDQIKLGLDYMSPKRQIFRDRLIKYVDRNKDDEKVGVNTLYASTQLYIALKYQDELNVLIKPRKFGDEEYADNLTDLAQYDRKEMWLNRLDHKRYFDECIFWYSIKTKDWRDDSKKVVKVWFKDPITWIPDPYGNYIRWFRWHYFEQEMPLSEMKQIKWYNEDEVEAYKLTELENNKTYRNAVNWTNNVIDNTLNKMVAVYSWYMYYEWKLYIVVVSPNIDKLFKFEEVTPVTQEEKISWYVDIKSVVNVSWFSPDDSPTGISLADLVEDKQKAQSILLNLRLIDAKFSTFWQTNLVNTSLIKDTTDLSRPSINTKWIWVNAGNNSLSNAVYPVPRQNILADSFNVSNELTRQIQLDTWIDSRSLWVQWDKNITLGEAQQIQANANVIFGLNIEVSNWADEDFWKYIWHRSYLEFFSSSDKKFVRIANWYWTNQVIFRKDDFLWWWDIDITIESAKKVMQERNRMKTDFMATLPMILQNPDTPKIVKSIAFRYSLKLQWHTREYQYLLNPYYSTEELKAKEYIQIVNINKTFEITANNLKEDLMTYYILLQYALDTEAKTIMLKKLEKALIETWQNLTSQDNGMGWLLNSTSNQLVSNAIWQNQNKVESLQSV